MQWDQTSNAGFYTVSTLKGFPLNPTSICSKVIVNNVKSEGAVCLILKMSTIKSLNFSIRKGQPIQNPFIRDFFVCFKIKKTNNAD